MRTPKDCAGRPLEIGQTVATNVSGYLDRLVLARVEAIFKSKIRLTLLDSNADYIQGSRPFLKFHEQVCII